MVQRIRRVQNERQGGFTLIELLIVIVVLGILAGIVVLGLGTFRKDATTAACKADVKQVQTAFDAFIASPSNPNGDYPTAIDGVLPTTLVGAHLLKQAPPVAEGVTLPATPADTVTSTVAGCS
jgi:prepilin-type N-terminal cleavage/methylation domain-containing protein